MNLPFNQQLMRGLLTNNSQIHVQQADAILSQQNFEFVGYHGTNRLACASILLNGFDIAFAGSSAGLARGAGLYVARNFQMAADFADTATQAGDPDPYTGIVPRRAGLASNGVVLRVYAKNFRSMKEGVHYVWGRMGGTSLNAVPANLNEQEIVFRKQNFQQLVAIPTSRIIETVIMGARPHTSPRLRPHEAPF